MAAEDKSNYYFSVASLLAIDVTLNQSIADFNENGIVNHV